MPDYSRRSEALEWMDDPSAPEVELRKALGELEVINRFLGGHRPSILGLQRLLPRGVKEFSLLDVGTGGGDGARAIVRWARSQGVTATVVGMDISPVIVKDAAARSVDYPEIEFVEGDLFQQSGEGEFDIVHTSLVLHHIGVDDAPRAVARMFAMSRFGVVVNDLHRHPIAYRSIALLTRLFSHSAMIRSDAPLSVLRAFSRDDWRAISEQADLPEFQLRWHWAFRWSAILRKEKEAALPPGDLTDV